MIIKIVIRLIGLASLLDSYYFYLSLFLEYIFICDLIAVYGIEMNLLILCYLLYLLCLCLYFLLSLYYGVITHLYIPPIKSFICLYWLLWVHAHSRWCPWGQMGDFSSLINFVILY